MNEIDDEIKLTINTMQCDIDDGAHGELQNHLYDLLAMKRNELQQRLAERSWAEPALGADKAKPLTVDELLAQRGLKAIEKTADEDLVFSADKMILFNADGAEVFNTDWPNPLVNPDQYEAHRRMAEWVDTFQEVKEDRVPLTADELKAGCWWCPDVSEECRSVLLAKGVSEAVVIRSYLRMKGLKQIHRIGNEFYWSQK